MSRELKCNICGVSIPTDSQGTVPADWGTLDMGLYVPDPNTPGAKMDIMPMQMHVCPVHDPSAIPDGKLEQAVGLALVSCLMPQTGIPAQPAVEATPAAPAPSPAPAPPVLPGQIPNAIAS